MPEGTVVAFDEHRGLGEVEARAPEDLAGARYPFHCTRIADGSRTIEVGASVTFVVTPGPLGRWEASAVTRA